MSKKLKKLLKAAAEASRLPLPDAGPPGIREPLDFVGAFVQAWNAGDADALAALFAEDADFVNVVGLWWTSRRSIRRAHAFGFERIFPDSQMTVEKVTQRLLGDDVSVVHARWRLAGQVGPQGEPVEQRRGVISAVLHRLADGSWIGVACQNTDIAIDADTLVARDGRLTATSYIEGPTAEQLAAAELVEDDQA